ncbi:hypothetical protein B7494_g4670 [Chlorociboria aeruginascens]|nr:hypothetical protein B7494_g4670 [Chlorociboria aeruginascens]
MPKDQRSHHRSTSSMDYYRSLPVVSNTQYAPITSRPIMSNYYEPMMQPSYSPQPTYATGGPVQEPMQQQYQPVPAAITSIRPSSGAWNPNDDQTLMAARAQGMNWAPIQQAYFPSKTPNACRKRHERLMERRSADDWDVLKLEELGKEYMELRESTWKPLAQRMGQKWNVIEQKCMSQGFKNLQSASRSFSRRERMLTGDNSVQLSYDSNTNVPQHDDSGLSMPDLEADYEADGSSDHSGNSLQPGQVQYSNGPYQQQRLPSMDMGIDAIINRPSGL